MKTIQMWLTPARRKAIYVVGVSIGTLLVVCGVVTPDMIDDGSEALGFITAFVLTLTNLLAAINTPTDVDN